MSAYPPARSSGDREGKGRARRTEEQQRNAQRDLDGDHIEVAEVNAEEGKEAKSKRKPRGEMNGKCGKRSGKEPGGLGLDEAEARAVLPVFRVALH